ncbi:MAG: prolipoprotein diacylglyceryl transferase [Bacteroidota bacterium]
MLHYQPHYYDLFYFLAVILPVWYLLWAGNKKGIPVVPWSLVLITTILFIILGSKIFTISPNQWRVFFEEGVLPANTGRTVLGALAGCLFSLYVCKKYFQFSYRVFDLIAPVIPLSMAIQRIGCFLHGCCFGTSTDAFWAVQYGFNTPAHIHHSNEGWISISDVASLSVHPNQLYQSFSCIIIFFLAVFYLKHKLHRPGNLLLSVVALYLVSRFFTEFFRADITNGAAGETWLELKYIQWILLFFVFTLFYIIRKREKIKSGRHPINALFTESVKKHTFIYYLLFITLLFSWSWLPSTEKLVISTAILSSFLFYLKHFSNSISLSGFKWTFLSLFPVLLVFFSFNTTQPDTIPQKKNYFSAGAGAYTGDYTYIVRGCNSSTYYHSKYNIYGLGVSYNHFDKAGNKWIFTGSFAKGIQTEANTKRHFTTVYNLIGGGLQARYEGKKWGYGLGGYYGRFVLGIDAVPGLPFVEVRYGNVKKLFLASGYGNQFPGVSGLENFYIETGTSLFNKKHDFKFGFTLAGFYLRAKLDLLKSKLSAEPYMYAGNFDSDPYNGYTTSRFGLALWWNFR